MRRSHPTPLIGLGLAGVVIGFLLELSAVTGGATLIVPPLSLPITLVAIAAIVIAFAIPIRRATHGSSGQPINPFRAMRVAVLAKACSLSGSLLVGGGIGILIHVFSRPVLPAGNVVVLAIAMAVGAAILLIAGLVAEHLCTLPPPSDDEKGAEHSHA